jgi:hypothetical protein
MWTVWIVEKDQNFACLEIDTLNFAMLLAL